MRFADFLADEQYKRIEELIERYSLSILSDMEQLLGDPKHPFLAILAAYVAMSAAMHLCEAEIANEWATAFADKNNLSERDADYAFEAYRAHAGEAVKNFFMEKVLQTLPEIIDEAREIASIPDGEEYGQEN